MIKQPIVYLRIIFSGIFISMLILTSWASLTQNLFGALPQFFRSPWTLATWFDAYFGFLIFYLWIFYKENQTRQRIFWFALVMLLGNLATSLYMLLQLFALPADAGIKQLLLKQNREEPQ